MTATRSRGRRRVDPRFQARRRTVAQREGRRRLGLVALLTVAASATIAAIIVANSSWADIDTVEVEGATRADPRQIVIASALVLGEPLLGLDQGSVQARVEAVPWVAEAEVKRSWLGTVTILVVERVAVVALPTGSRFAVVDRTGRQLEVVADRPEGFMTVAGVDASGVPGQPVSEEGLAVVTLVEQIPAGLEAQTKQIVVEDGRLMIELVSGGRVNFGDERELDDKFVAIDTVLARVDLSCLASIDVRVPTAPTVRRTTDTAGSQERLTTAGGC